MNTTPGAYSYIRFSTPEQEKGDSLRRQEKDAEDYAKKHGLTLDENQPDMVVVNVTKDQIWVRDGVISDYPNVRPSNAAASVEKYGGFVVPVPIYRREDIQS
jgi:hypothetical protein